MGKKKVLTQDKFIKLYKKYGAISLVVKRQGTREINRYRYLDLNKAPNWRPSDGIYADELHTCCWGKGDENGLPLPMDVYATARRMFDYDSEARANLRVSKIRVGSKTVWSEIPSTAKSRKKKKSRKTAKKGARK